MKKSWFLSPTPFFPHGRERPRACSSSEPYLTTVPTCRCFYINFPWCIKANMACVDALHIRACIIVSHLNQVKHTSSNDYHFYDENIQNTFSSCFLTMFILARWTLFLLNFLVPRGQHFFLPPQLTASPGNFPSDSVSHHVLILHTALPFIRALTLCLGTDCCYFWFWEYTE